MKALVLTAGLGTRLRPLTLVRAKAAVPADGEPLVRRVIRSLAAQGVTDVVLNLHHRPESITGVVGDGSDLGVRVRYSWEVPVLGSAGGPRHALPLLMVPGTCQAPATRGPRTDHVRATHEPGTDARGPTNRNGNKNQLLTNDSPTAGGARSVPGQCQAPTRAVSGPDVAVTVEPRGAFLLVNGDTLTDLDVRAMVTAHERTGALVTMALIENPRPDKYGGVLLNEDGAVTAFTRRGHPGPSFHFIGVQVVEPQVFLGVPDGTFAESVLEIYPTLMKDAPGAVRGYVSRASFQDVGTPADLLETSLALAAADGRPDAPRAGRNVRVHPSATVTRTLLWDDVTVDAGAQLRDCIVADGVRVRAGERFDRAVLVIADGDRTVTPL